MVFVSAGPAAMGFGEATRAPPTSATPAVVDSVSELLDGKFSGSADDTEAVAVIVPVAVAMTVTTTDALLPQARLPRSQMTVPARFEQAPCDDTAETKFTVAGRALLTS